LYYIAYPFLWISSRLTVGGSVEEFLNGGASGIHDEE
jgi:hypothetical protein